MEAKLQSLSFDYAHSPALERIDGKNQYDQWVRDLKGRSGVYAIYSTKTGKCLYVGESHTGRLYDTLTRHFREWRVDHARDRQGRRFGGTMYSAATVEVAVVTCKPSEAAELQDEAILFLEPQDNSIVPITADIEAEDYDDFGM